MSSFLGAPMDHCSQNAIDKGAVFSTAPLVELVWLSVAGIVATNGANAIPESSAVSDALLHFMGMYRTVVFLSEFRFMYGLWYQLVVAAKPSQNICMRGPVASATPPSVKACTKPSPVE